MLRYSYEDEMLPKNKQLKKLTKAGKDKKPERDAKDAKTAKKQSNINKAKLEKEKARLLNLTRKKILAEADLGNTSVKITVPSDNAHVTNALIKEIEKANLTYTITSKPHFVTTKPDVWEIKILWESD